MVKKTYILSILFVFVCILSNVSVANQGVHSDRQLILKLSGTGEKFEMQVPGTEEGEAMAAMCFDIDLIDMRNNEIIGTGTDCLSDVQPSGTDNGLSLIGTTFFYLPQGTLIARGDISVQPVLKETILKSGQIVTHITGGSGEGNSIIGGTGAFTNTTGNARLSGMVNMDRLGEGLLVFDCIFVVTLDRN